MRVLAAFAVVVIHIPGRGTAWGDLSRWAVPIFVVVSGALLLGQPGSESLGAFYRRRALRVIPVWLVWNLVYFCLPYRGDHLTVAEAVRTLWVRGGFYGHLWFLPMMFTVYLMTPRLRVVVRRLSGAQIVVISMVLIGAGWVWVLHTRVTLDTPPAAEAVPYVGYFLLGYWLDQVRSRGWVLPLAMAAVGSPATRPTTI